MDIMKSQDKDLFEKYAEYYSSYIKHQFIRNYSKEVYSDLIHLYTSYVNSKHNFSHWCSSCRTELVMHLYNWYYSQEPQIEEPQAQIVIETVEEPVLEKRKGRRKKQQ